MVDDAGQASDKFCCRNAFVLSLVRKHWAGANIAHGIDARNICLEIVTYLNLATRVDREPCLVKRKTIGICAATNGDKDAIRLDRFAGTATGGLDGQCCSCALDRCASDLCSSADVEALLLENLRCFLTDLAVHAGQNLVKIFNHGDLCA